MNVSGGSAAPAAWAFRSLIALWLVMQFIWQILPYFNIASNLPERTAAILGSNGFGGWQIISDPWFYGSVIVVKGVAAILLLSFSRIGIWIFLLVLVLDILAAIYGGVAVLLPADLLAIFVTCTLEGAILTMVLSGLVPMRFSTGKSDQQ